MSTRDGLDVDLGIPILIDEDDGAGGGEVDAESSSASRDEEDLVGRVVLLKELDVEGATRAGGGTVEAGVCSGEEGGERSAWSLPRAMSNERLTLEAPELHKVLEDVEHTGESRENKDLLALGENLGE